MGPYPFESKLESKLEIERIECEFTACRVADVSEVDLTSRFCFVGRTDEEVSLVCPTEDVPERAIKREDGWRAFRIRGVLDFSLVGVLARLSAVLAGEGIGIFAVSTFNTDYILVKKEHFDRAMAALGRAGYTVI